MYAAAPDMYEMPTETGIRAQAATGQKEKTGIRMAIDGKRAYAAQLREQKAMFYKRKILELIDRMNRDLFSVDYTAEIERMKKESPADKAIIAHAEREAFKEGKG